LKSNHSFFKLDVFGALSCSFWKRLPTPYQAFQLKIIWSPQWWSILIRVKLIIILLHIYIYDNVKITPCSSQFNDSKITRFGQVLIFKLCLKCPPWSFDSQNEHTISNYECSLPAFPHIFSFTLRMCLNHIIPWLHS
jgi:hypothetical protein